MFDMRLFKRGKYYYVQVARGIKKSLGVTNKLEADALFKALQKQQLEGRLHILDAGDNLKISEFIKRYVDDADRRGLSQDTLRADRLAFISLIDTIGDIPMGFISKGKIKKFKDASAKRLSPHSVNTYLRHIKAGLNWAKAEDIIKDVPAIKSIKTGKRVHRTIQPKDIDKILSTARSTRPAIYSIIVFALYTATRRSEIVGARWEHIKDGTIRIVGKGDKERIIPLFDKAIELMPMKDIGWIFPYRHVSTLSNYFRMICRVAGVNARFHDLRHTAATHMLKNKIDLKMVKEILGHSDIRTTEIYAEVLASEMKKEMAKLTYDFEI